MISNVIECKYHIDEIFDWKQQYCMKVKCVWATVFKMIAYHINVFKLLKCCASKQIHVLLSRPHVSKKLKTIR